MNVKFYALPQEKQTAILNAGFHVFSQNSYKKSPVSEIAEAAGISKALLFHYFHNKKELYLFLWEYIQRGEMDIDAMGKDFRSLLDFWKTVYLRKAREKS